MSSAGWEKGGWNHNTHYHDTLLAAVPQACDRALDVGCGTGAFARRVSPLARRLDAIDADATIIRRASEQSAGFRNIRFAHADFMTWTEGGPYDFISMIAVLHHLPFAEALAKAADLLRSGGVLATLGLDRAPSLLHEGARSIVAYPLSTYYRVTRGMAPVDAPLAEPTMTLSEIRGAASRLLPGVTVRRHLLWRYSIIWMKR